MKLKGRTPREQTIISRMMLGHTGLNKTMFLLKKHPSGLFDCGTEDESVEHVICHCVKYSAKSKIKRRVKEIWGECIKS